MNVVQSAVEFRGYRVLETYFSLTDVVVEPGKEFNLTPTFSRVIIQKGEGRYTLTLGVKIGSQDNEEKLPFVIEVKIEGEFLLQGIENADAIMKVNATAIMFPYIRSTVSLITALMNIDPIVLPTINLAQMFENEIKNSEDIEK
ncbi:Protein-export protein SecB [bioreactor metagenome]|uniref:Protein-export protein SecB n=1 Tax=bioreactor metagenome TaxID=1076179 RepID=A0A644Y2X1_9ZZZZ